MAAAMVAKFGDGAVSVALGQAEAARSVDDQIFDRWQSIARSIQEHEKHGRARRMTTSADQNFVADPLCQRDNIDYLRSREVKERALAASATIPSVRDAHFHMAERYADAIWSAEEEVSSRRYGR